MPDLNSITETIIGSAIRVHRELGPGLLESAYRACLAFELTDSGLRVKEEEPLPVVYREVRLVCAYKMDLLVEDQIIIELKSVEKIAPIHKAQLISYLKLADLRVGLLINFNERILKDGIHRLVNNLKEG